MYRWVWLDSDLYVGLQQVCPFGFHNLIHHIHQGPKNNRMMVMSWWHHSQSHDGCHVISSPDHFCFKLFQVFRRARKKSKELSQHNWEKLNQHSQLNARQQLSWKQEHSIIDKCTSFSLLPSPSISPSLYPSILTFALFLPIVWLPADGLLKMLYMILLHQQFRHPGAPSRALVATSPLPTTSSTTAVAESDINNITLALQTLGSFNFGGRHGRMLRGCGF